MTRAADLALIGFAFAELIYSALALWLVWTGRKQSGGGKTPLVFIGAVVATAIWAGCGLAEQTSSNPLWAWATSLFDLLRYALWFLLLLLLLRPQAGAGGKRLGRLYASVAVLLLAFGLISLVIEHQSAIEPGGTLAHLVLLSAMALPLFGLVLLEQLFRNVASDLRWNAKPLSLGLAGIFVFDLYVYSQALLFGRYDAEALAIRAGIHGLAAPLLFMASARQSQDIGRLQVSRTAAFHSATLLLVGGYLLFISAIGYYVRYFGGDWGRALQIAVLFVALVLLSILVISGSLRARLRVFVGKHFFSYRYDYRDEWLRFTAMLSAKSAPHEVGGLVVRGLAEMLECPSGCLWAKGPDDEEFVQSAQWNMARSDETEPVGSPLSRFLLEQGWIIDLDEYRATPDHYDQLVLPPWMLASPEFWLVVPLQTADELIGFVVLGKARAAIDVNWEVRDLLKTASRQAAGFLAQMQATEALLEARKFEAFNKMSAFVVHDLKNIVTQLSLMMKNAKRLHDNPEFQQDMLTTVESSLDKMRQLMLQLREGEAPSSRQSGVDLVPIARRLEAVASGRGRKLEVQVVDRVATRGHEERIERVLGHLVQNALDATGPQDRVWLRLERASGQARVEIGDTGHGMTQDFINTRLFKPFNTTKESGMGIGSYESFQYVRELGGRIDVDSQVDQGTLVTVVMPLFDAKQGSDLSLFSTR